MENEIAVFRGITGLSQLAFSKILGVSVSTLRRWEAGLATPSPLAMLRINNIKKMDINLLLEQISNQEADDSGNIEQTLTLSVGGKIHKAVYMPCVYNGPSDQLSFHMKLISLQEKPELRMDTEKYLRRLSLIKSADDILTAQYEIERPKATAKCWSSDYGTHGYHRYVGRFPSHLIRALLNYFEADQGETVLDPFCGSGTTLVEARMLGAQAIGIEISPLSALISSVKCTFPDEGLDSIRIIKELTSFYTCKWSEFCIANDIHRCTYEDIIKRAGNLIPAFANYEKWLTREALLGVSIVIEYINTQSGYLKDFLMVALSAKMRSIGNVDVDVVRAEYRRTPRENVDVLKLMSSQIQKMVRSGQDMLKTHKGIIGNSGSVSVIEGNALSANITPGSIAHIITSPPYGVESLSYLRTHLLSFRVLEPLLGIDPYKFNEGVIGSEYLSGEDVNVIEFNVSRYSPTYAEFFIPMLESAKSGNDERRVIMMMKFFEDMQNIISKFYIWLKPKGKVAFVIGNKKIGDALIPTDTIIREIFEASGFVFEQSIAHKLKTNNSNSQVPWQERIIENEFVMIFERT